MGFYEFKESDAWNFARASGIEAKQRGDELQFLTCPYCRGGRSADKGTFSINLTTGQFKCLRSSCSVSGNMITLARDFDWFTLGPDADVYYKTGKQKQYRRFKRMEPIKPKTAAITYLEGRGISSGTAVKYQITVQNEHENILVFPFLDEKGSMQFVKYRKTDFDPAVDKEKEWCEPNCKPILFGMYQCNLDNKTLILTEGQIDSLSVSEAGMVNAVSVPTGKNGFTWIPYCWDWLQNFNTLIVFGDNENGHITLLDDMKRRFRGTVKVVRQQDYRGCKDANEILQKYGRDAVRDAVEHAEAVPVQAVEDLSDVKSVDLFSLPKIPTGIRSLDRILSGGIYLGQTVILTGKRGDGKSTFASQLLANALNDGKTILAYSGELPDYFFKRWIDFQIAGKQNVIDRVGESGSVNYYIPKEKTERISEWYRGRAFLYDNRSAGDDEPGDLLETIEKAIQQYGVQLVLLDNLMTALDVGMNVDLYRAQSKFVDKLVKMAVRQQVAVILVVHPRKNKYGSDDTDEVSGSADITNKVDLVMTYRKDMASQENERLLTVSKNRLTGKLAVGERALKLYYDESSKRVSDNTDDFTRPFGWEADGDGFLPVTEEQMEQMEIPFE
ncbi:MAG: ATPase domain-containing protein [Blautia sp.]|nr:ATPase domain-containing protein [Blautia sp.]